MANTKHPQRGIRCPEEIRRRVSADVEREGVRFTARKLGMNRQTVLSLVANLPVLPGTVALAREAYGSGGRAA